ncbi:hypothetical protein VCHENC02_4409, partial [Vibrio harveyi]
MQCLDERSFSFTAARQFWILTRFPFQPSRLLDSTSLGQILL